MLRIGIDDTDSTSGWCTTYMVTQLVKEFSEYDLIGYPRLVRLNPMIPMKTRGNGAIVISLGRGRGKAVWVGRISGKDIFMYEQDTHNSDNDELKSVSHRVETLLKKYSDIRNGANPGYVVCKGYPPQSLYWRGVRVYVQMKDVLHFLPEEAIYGGFNGSLGVIGAACALAWRPRDRTWELITYREKKRIGTQREVDEQSVIKMDQKFPETFSNYDYRHKRILITPRTPCPILFGVRSDNPVILREAAESIESEPWDTCTLFLTNQGTDDHIIRTSIPKIARYMSVSVKGKVCTPPITMRGGHVLFKVSGSRGRCVDCAAYEPTKEFRDIIRRLLPGDRVRVWGGVRNEPLTINLEGIEVIHLTPFSYERPLCCGRRMESMGKNKGFRCRVCRKKKKTLIRVEQNRTLRPGIYHVPLCAARHISMTEKRRLKRSE